MSERYKVRGRPWNDPIAAVYDYGITDDLLKAAILALNVRVTHGFITWIEIYRPPYHHFEDVTCRAFSVFVQTRRRPLSWRNKPLVVEATEAILFEATWTMDPMIGNILKGDAEAIVNPVNCVGVMGKGLALEFKRAFPENFEVYKSACSDGLVRLGRVHIFATGLANPKYIVNFPTKRHWRDRAEISDIGEGLCSLVAEVRRFGMKSIAVPPLGCGLGGLSWDTVKPMIEHMFLQLPEVRLVLYEPR